MSAVIIEHVKVSDLPEDWRAKLHAAEDARVTIRIEEESVAQGVTLASTLNPTDDPAFGIWSDREETADVDAYVGKLRETRYDSDGSRNKG